ncbi:MAG: hypothetical protein IK062_03060 [Selenomonadaceae bacterium]|nr:hypothetical protein [Selenomonadaceae bacterium]
MQIKNFSKIEYFTEFELTKHEGEHSRLNFSASILENTAKSFLNCAGKEISVTTEDNEPIFFGRVESVEVENNFGASRIYASCVSLSIKADEEEKTRIFHNSDKKISDVLNTSRLSLESADLKLSEKISALKYSPVILQNQETNFQFISRLAKNFGERLWILDTMQQANFFIDSCMNKSARKIERDKILSMRHAKVGKQFKFFVKSQKFFDLGQVVIMEGNTTEFVIVGLKIKLERESYFFYYELEEHKTPPKKISDAPILTKTFKLHAKIKNVKDPKNLGKVQVTFDDKFVEDMDEKNPLWISYRTPYSGKDGGIVFIPDEGDAVEVIFTNEEIFCVSAIRENPLATECQKVSEKYIGNNFKQRIFWKEKSLELFSDKYRIIMNEKGIEISVGENSIALTEEGILLKTKESKISLTKDIAAQADEKIELKSKNYEIKSDEKIKLDGKEIFAESNGAANIKAGGTLKLAGNKIELC